MPPNADNAPFRITSVLHLVECQNCVELQKPQQKHETVLLMNYCARYALVQPINKPINIHRFNGSEVD